MSYFCNHPGCGNPRFSHGFCSWHQKDRTDEKYQKSIALKGQKEAIRRAQVLKRHNAPGKPSSSRGEAQVFESVWNSRPHVSFLTGDPINIIPHSDLWYSCFAHVLPKGKYPLFRLLEKNMILLLPEEHTLLDQGHSEQRRRYEEAHGCFFEKIYNLADGLKLLYEKVAPRR